MTPSPKYNKLCVKTVLKNPVSKNRLYFSAFSIQTKQNVMMSKSTFDEIEKFNAPGSGAHVLEGISYWNW